MTVELPAVPETDPAVLSDRELAEETLLHLRGISGLVNQMVGQAMNNPMLRMMMPRE